MQEKIQAWGSMTVPPSGARQPQGEAAGEALLAAPADAFIFSVPEHS